MKLDPHHHKERYLVWKEQVKNGIKEVGERNSELILRYVFDMEKGINVSSKSARGSRSFIRLNTIREKMTYFAKKFKELYGIDYIVDISEEQVISFFSDMKNGVVARIDGKTYRSVDTFSKVFKAFWHWHMKVNRKKGIEIHDITIDIDTKQDKPSWVYLTEEQVKKLCDNAKFDYKVLMLFLFDSGIRSPTELMNIKVSDLYNNCKEVHVREEVSKTFGRRFKLMLCSELLSEYIKVKGLKLDDYLFPINYYSLNKYLKRLAVRLFGDGKTEAGGKYSELSLYDFRHCACCYWLPRYKSESALKYRFGWKKSDKIHYYSELLGMKDTISEEDLLVDVTKTEIEKRLEKSEKEKEILQERLLSMEGQMEKILEMMKVAGKKMERMEMAREIRV